MWCVCLSICCVCDSCAWIWICDKYLLHRNRYNSCERETIYQLIRSVLGVITLVLWWRLLYFFVLLFFLLNIKASAKYAHDQVDTRGISEKCFLSSIRHIFFIDDWYALHEDLTWLISHFFWCYWNEIDEMSQNHSAAYVGRYLIIMTVWWVYVIDDLRSTLWCSKLLLTQPYFSYYCMCSVYTRIILSLVKDSWRSYTDGFMLNSNDQHILMYLGCSYDRTNTHIYIYHNQVRSWWEFGIERILSNSEELSVHLE